MKIIDNYIFHKGDIIHAVVYGRNGYEVWPGMKIINIKQDKISLSHKMIIQYHTKQAWFYRRDIFKTYDEAKQEAERRNKL